MTPREQAAVLRACAGGVARTADLNTEDMPLCQALEAGAWALDLTATLIDALKRSPPEQVHSAAREFAVLAANATGVLSSLAPGHDAQRRFFTRQAIRYGLAELALHVTARAMEATPAEVQS